MSDAFWERLALDLQTPARPDELVPPPRFRTTTFDRYAIDPATPGQAEAVAAIRAFAVRGQGFASWFQRTPPGLYLDGGFGVGKTHLIAACYHAARGTRRYLAFSEAMALMIQLGPRKAADLLAADLVCIDEFEIDDPTNTRLADLLLDDLTARGCRIVTTSNTVPGELGQGRMAIDQFRNQLARIANKFTSVTVPGKDHRRVAKPGIGGKSRPASQRPDPRQLTLSGARLDQALRAIPVPNLRRVAAALDRLTITSLAPFDDQLAALRFVHLVDRLYDHEVDIEVGPATQIDTLFPAPYCQPAFSRKYLRCISRLCERPEF